MAGLVSMSTASFAQPQQPSVVEAKFLVTLIDPEGQRLVYESNEVPLEPYRACYGWFIRLAGVEGMVKLREVFSLPAEPEMWSGEEDKYSPNTIAKDRLKSVTEKFAVPEDGWVSNTWCVAEGDPEGRYSMEISIDGTFVERFDFDVIRPD